MSSSQDSKNQFEDPSQFGGSPGQLDDLFRDGGGKDPKTQYIIIGLVLLGLGLAGFFYMGGADAFFGESPEETPAGETPSEPSSDAAAGEEEAEVDHPAEENKKDAHPAEEAKDPAGLAHEAPPAPPKKTEPSHPLEIIPPKPPAPHKGAQALPGKPKNKLSDLGIAPQEEIHTLSSSSAPTPVTPEDMATHHSDKGVPAEFRWEGGGGTLLLAQSKSMKPVKLQFVSQKSHVKYRLLTPGTWYWQVKNSKGTSQVRTLEVLPPIQRQIELQSPKESETLAGSGGIVSWSGDARVAFYRVQLSRNGTWDKPDYVFATSGSSLELNEVKPGDYQIRVGAFSGVSGEWEYGTQVSVHVQ
jgi:hypothetical protein